MMDDDRFVVLDDRQWAELGAERREATLAALYSAAMRGLPDDDLRHLCGECGVTYEDVTAWVQPVLRPTGRRVSEPWEQPIGGDPALDQQCPF